MKKGQTVIIYFNAIRKVKEEGPAKLIKKLSESFYGSYKLEKWKVQFIGETHYEIRTIREEMK